MGSLKKCCYKDCEDGRRNLGKYCKFHDKVLRRSYRYGISREEVEEYHKETNCAICEKEFLSLTDLQFDHNPKTGVMRGILCRNCNTALGKFKESPDLVLKAYKYLTK